jgi:hypothetical protein
MNVFKFNEYYHVNLEYLALDWDDNILHMSTMIHMEKLVNGEWVREDVSTSKFALVRKDPEWRCLPGEESFNEFRDFGPRGKNAFLQDAIEAINNGEFGPSWDAFIEYLSKGTIFAIITARGHEPESIRKVIEYIIDNVLSEEQKHSLYANCLKFAYLFKSDYDSYDRVPKGNLSQTKLISDYLDTCDFYGITSKYCKDKFGHGNTLNPEVGKEMAIKEFTKKVNDFGKKIGSPSVSLGFSDDDVRTSKHIGDIFSGELALQYAINYNLYDTSKRGLKGGIRTQIPHQVTETQNGFGTGAGTWGKDSSVLPFSKWNNMTQALYPNGKDVPNDDYHNQLKNQLGEIGELTDDIDVDELKNDETDKVKKFEKKK